MPHWHREQRLSRRDGAVLLGRRGVHRHGDCREQWLIDTIFGRKG